MRLINRCCISSSCRRPGFGFQDQLRLVITVLGHLALFQLVETSTQSTSYSASASASASPSPSSAGLSLPLGNGIKYALPKGRCRGQDVISSVPEKDRGLFIYYHLAKALNSPSTNKNILSARTNIEREMPNKITQTFKDIRTYDTFSADLLKWTMQTFERSQFDVYDLLLRRYRRLCTSKGLCFSPNDIGSMCCPF